MQPLQTEKASKRSAPGLHSVGSLHVRCAVEIQQVHWLQLRTETLHAHADQAE